MVSCLLSIAGSSLQSESTLWRLKIFVKEALEVQAKNAASLDGTNNNNTNNVSNNNKNNTTNNNKRKKDICDAIAKTVKKKSKKPRAVEMEGS